MLDFSSDGVSKAVNFTERSSRNLAGKMKLKVGELATQLELTCSVFLQNRSPGGRLFISLASVYKALQLTQYKGYPSKWIFAHKAKWQQRMQQHLGDGHIICSAGEQTTLPWEMRCLLEAAVSMTGLLYLLVQWCAAPQKSGGFEKEAHRHAARELLVALTNAAAECIELDKRDVRVAFATGWRVQWPRPPAFCTNAGLCVPLNDGCFDVSGLHAAAKVEGARQCGLVKKVQRKSSRVSVM